MKGGTALGPPAGRCGPRLPREHRPQDGSGPLGSVCASSQQPVSRGQQQGPHRSVVYGEKTTSDRSAQQTGPGSRTRPAKTAAVLRQKDPRAAHAAFPTAGKGEVWAAELLSLLPTLTHQPFKTNYFEHRRLGPELAPPAARGSSWADRIQEGRKSSW